MQRIKIFFAAVAFCAVTFVGYNTYKQATMTEEERFLQANIDALSEDESGEVTCKPDKGDTCLVGSTPVQDYDEKDSWF